jgi:hypothetical protein
VCCTGALALSFTAISQVENIRRLAGKDRYGILLGCDLTPLVRSVYLWIRTLALAVHPH